MMRHALAPGTGDPPNFRLEDCSTQRNLSAQGRAQARRIGEAFRRRGVKVARVLSSQWCRCLETARLMNLGAVEPFAPLNSFFRDRSTQTRQTTEVREFIAANRNTFGAIILVTHQVNITALTDIVPQSGESVVLRANQQNQVEVIGRIESFRDEE
jgi:phosphohistidine phosphatase SixA